MRPVRITQDWSEFDKLNAAVFLTLEIVGTRGCYDTGEPAIVWSTWLHPCRSRKRTSMKQYVDLTGQAVSQEFLPFRGVALPPFGQDDTSEVFS
mmetsp:Transcript_9826/g.20016  ORF Transcript_9826/g.20016 Transcript_9826/m.20016 type:complete len:94 (-) Transcript_9826:23-304(-)